MAREFVTFLARLDPAQHEALKARALETGQSMNELVCEGLALVLGAPRSRPAKPVHATGRCSHPEVTKRETTFGWRRFCADPDCGVMIG